MRAVRAVDHGGVGAVGLVGRGLDGGRGVAAGEHDQLLGLQGEAVGLLEGRQGRRRVHELGRAGQHHLAAAGDPVAEVGHGD